MPLSGRKRDPRSLVPGGVQNLVTALHPEIVGTPVAAAALAEATIDELWLEDQPRQIIPEEILATLVTAERSRPADLLEALRSAALGEPYYAGVLARVEELADSIKANGVLTPLLVVRRDGRLVVRDGHRRSLAALIAERIVVPIRLIDEPSDVEGMARQFVVNIQREDFTALDKARWTLRLARIVEREITEALAKDSGRAVVDVLVREQDVEGVSSDEPSWRSLPASERELARRIQERVCVLTGMQTSSYYRLMALNRLSPEARLVGMSLSEAQLRPVTSLPFEEQATTVAFIARHGLGRREATSLVNVVKSGEPDAVQRVMARLAKEDVTRQRAAVSWEPLLRAVPKDVSVRCEALFAELKALPDAQRQTRLGTMREQEQLLGELARQFAEMRAYFGEVDL
jgi:hypothetical protein